jgi:hypothetical protein
VESEWRMSGEGVEKEWNFNDYKGVYFQDITFVIDGNPSFRGNPPFLLHNWWKGKLLHRIVSDALLFQTVCWKCGRKSRESFKLN